MGVAQLRHQFHIPLRVLQRLRHLVMAEQNQHHGVIGHDRVGVFRAARIAQRLVVVPHGIRLRVRAPNTHISQASRPANTDADFFNARRHGVETIRRLHKEFPTLTYDFTTRVDHILDNADTLRELAGMGLRFITSALEFPKQRVLDEVFKEVTVEMIEASIVLMRPCGIVLNPTFIMFNPWVGLDDLAMFSEFVERNDLDAVIDPIQYETRLHLYKGSPLLKNPSIRALELREHEFHFDRKHPDPRVDELYQQSITPAEKGVFKRCCLKC